MPTRSQDDRAVRPFHVTSADYCRWGYRRDQDPVAARRSDHGGRSGRGVIVCREDGTAAWDVWTLNETIALLSLASL